MPTINFRLLATPSQLGFIEEDFRNLIAAMGDQLDAELQLTTGLVPDPELVTTWVEQYGEDIGSDADSAQEDSPEGAEIKVTVQRYDMGSLSGLTMYFAKLLTVREKDPAEPLLRQVKDDLGAPRVPWHVQVQP
ncbi:hypothetical protein [Corynebacterium anserum]|uniref:Uncharacterized protein n=1 Tax=Corynebacterium anserum TaxID=2684406 RepID=A0A7G7YN38_9CORY|nr:hypothetical protein [Corynebacterium anserum]QNH95908.1 hypothetical protein GP473_03730 [Corynebacterium anserum]